MISTTGFVLTTISIGAIIAASMITIFARLLVDIEENETVINGNLLAREQPRMAQMVELKTRIQV